MHTTQNPSGLIPNLHSCPRQVIFLTPVDSELHHFLLEIHQIALRTPKIIQLIEADLDLHAKKKKLLRLADAQYFAGQTPSLPELKIALSELTLDSIILETGRPRTEAYLVYLFLMLRGFNGGCKDQQAILLLTESMTLRLWLDPLGAQLPRASTLSEVLNAVSNETRHQIHRAQLSYILDEKLDDFSTVFIDSTGVKANSERPTDSGLMVKLLDRIFSVGKKLDRVELLNMELRALEVQLPKLSHLNQQVFFLKGKKQSEGKRKTLYFQMIRRVRRLRKLLLREFERVQKNFAHRGDMPPSRRLQAEVVLDLIAGDIAALQEVADAAEKRVLEEIKVPMAEKIISISDCDASFIVKGGWDSIVGYRPQITRSGSGFVTGLHLPVGNAADSPQLVSMVEKHVTNTGNTIPTVASADDGYSSVEGRCQLLDAGISVVSISGSKGKKITGAKEWKSKKYRAARSERSGMESLMFTLKYNHEFGHMARREHASVLAEMLEKVLAYNICHIIRVRRQKAAEALKAAAA